MEYLSIWCSHACLRLSLLQWGTGQRSPCIRMHACMHMCKVCKGAVRAVCCCPQPCITLLVLQALLGPSCQRQRAANAAHARALCSAPLTGPCNNGQAAAATAPCSACSCCVHACMYTHVDLQGRMHPHTHDIVAVQPTACAALHQRRMCGREALECMWHMRT